MSTDAPAQVTPGVRASITRDNRWDHSVVLSDLSWGEYVTLRDKQANRGLRMTYATGVLEIMTLSSFHELISKLIDHFILEWRVARNIPVRPSGSMTLRRELLDRGLEGDQSYYIQNESKVRALDEIDLNFSPPPDLAIEVEHHSPAIGKLPIYAALGVPELWHWRAEVLTVYRLVGKEYKSQPHSDALPGFPFDQLNKALAQRQTVDETALLRDFRRWIAQQESDSK